MIETVKSLFGADETELRLRFQFPNHVNEFVQLSFEFERALAQESDSWMTWSVVVR